MWRALLADAPAGAPWVGFVREALARVDGGAGSPPPGPERRRYGCGRRHER